MNNMATEYAPNRIREWRLKRGMTLEQVAHAVSDDTAISTIAKLEKRAMGFTLDWMNRLATALDVSLFDLIEAGRSVPQIRMVPIRGAIAAGACREAVEDDLGFAPCPVDVGGPDAYALRVEGDSMNRIVRDGGVIVLDPRDRDLIDQKVYAVRNGAGEATFKRFVASPPTLEPVSDNDDHKPIALGREPFTVLARVVYAEYQP